MKKTILFLALGLAITTQHVFAQVPSYVPTSGLVGYWPFNGNANDESGNGNNGTVNGATLTTDRNGNNNKAFQFEGVNCCGTPDAISEIAITNNFLSLNSNFTISCWMKSADVTKYQQCLFNSIQHTGFAVELNSEHVPNKLCFGVGPANAFWDLLYAPGITNNFQNNIWYNVTFVKSGTNYTLFLNGNIEYSTSVNAAVNYNELVGLRIGSIGGGNENFKGSLDDYIAWNRALSPEEITNLYSSVNSSECLTMVINTGVLSTNPVTYTSTVNIYPNPANDQITIDCGNLANVVGWNIKITNMLGQEVFNQPMNTQQYVVPLNSWTGQGMYFVKIINAQNEVVNIKKIILQ